MSSKVELVDAEVAAGIVHFALYADTTKYVASLKRKKPDEDGEDQLDDIDQQPPKKARLDLPQDDTQLEEELVNPNKEEEDEIPLTSRKRLV